MINIIYQDLLKFNRSYLLIFNMCAGQSIHFIVNKVSKLNRIAYTVICVQ